MTIKTQKLLINVIFLSSTNGISLVSSSEILQEKGAVSKDCAYAMAQGLHKRTGCNIAICTTGIAGPTGGTPNKPVGLVFISVFYKDNIYVKDFRFPSFIPRRLMKYLFAQKAIDCAYKIIFSEI